MFEAEVGIELDPERLTRLVHFDPHRFWLAFLAARLSSELVKTLNGKVMRAGEFNTRASTGNRAAKVI